MVKRLYKIGNLRAVAILLVVLGHSIILYSDSWNLYETNQNVPFLNMLKEFIDIVQMPLYFSLSGYLFVFTHKKKLGLICLLKNKLRRLIVPYLSIGILYMLPIRIAVGFPSYKAMGVREFIYKLLTASDVGHLWFLPALFFIFLFSELVLSIVENIPVVNRYPDLLLCLVSLVLYLEGYWISFGYPPVLSAFAYMLWFAFGYFIHIHETQLCKIYSITTVKIVLIILSLCMSLYCLYVDRVRLGFSLMMQALLIINAYGAVPKDDYCLTEKIDRNSFGIYLFHSPLIYVTYSLIPNAHPGLVVFINLFLFGAVAYGITEFLRNTRLKALIGE